MEEDFNQSCLQLGVRKRGTGWPVAMPGSAHINLQRCGFARTRAHARSAPFKTDINGYGYKRMGTHIPVQITLQPTHLN